MAPTGRADGGLGKCAVLSPVVSALYGPGGGLFASSSSSLLRASSLSCRRCLADPSGAVAAAPLDAVGSAP